LTGKAGLVDSSAMQEVSLIEWIRDKYRHLSSELDERGRRRWAAIEARSLGRGGIVAVATATGISDARFAPESRTLIVLSHWLQIGNAEGEVVASR